MFGSREGRMLIHVNERGGDAADMGRLTPFVFREHIMRLSLTAALVAAGSILSTTASHADIVFCNQFDHLVYVAIAYPQSGGSFISRGWMSLSPGDCSPFDTAIRVKTFYFRGESEPYRDGSGHKKKYSWGKGKPFAIWEKDNFQYYDAEHRVLKSTLEEFTQGPESDSGDVSAKVTFKEGGSTTEFNR